MVFQVHEHKQHHENCNGWYLTLVVLIASVDGLMIL